MVGETLGSYRVLDRLGEGGMGAVYTGEHTIIGKRVAIKVLLPGLSKDEAIVQRFFNEAKAATRIRHPGIVEVFDFGHHTDGSAFIVMELLQGEPLSARMRRAGRMPAPACARILHQIAGALDAAHAAGIVHRDLKPDNIFVVPDPDVTSGERVKVLDFGIAKLAGDLSAGEVKTRTGAIVGTPRYMAPEQCRGAREVDHRADLYALGCIAFEMLCGRPPFLDKGLGELFAAHMFAEPPRPGSLAPAIPLAFESIVLCLLAKEPDQRFGRAAALMAALERAEQGVSEPHGAMHGGRLAAPDSWPGRASTSTLALGPALGSHDVVPGMVPTPTTLGSAASFSSAQVSAASPARRGWLWMAASAAVLAGLGGVAFMGFRGQDEGAPPQSVTSQAAGEVAGQPSGRADPAAPQRAASRQGAAPAARDDAAGGNRWVRIAPPPAGKRVMLGLSDPGVAKSDALGLRPEREVLAPVSAYEVQRHEVTWGELEPWLGAHPEAAVHRPGWVPADAAQRERMPATGIPWETAYAYCRSLGARLPSEAEWEYAARGPGLRPYAWGRERLDTYRTNAFAGEGARVVEVMTKDQDRTPGEAHQALHDMMGNAREWVADLWRNDRPGEDESWVQAGGATFRTVRGLPVAAPLPDRLPVVGAAYRDALCASEVCIQGSEQLLGHVGFRCARDVRGAP